MEGLSRNRAPSGGALGSVVVWSLPVIGNTYVELGSGTDTLITWSISPAWTSSSRMLSMGEATPRCPEFRASFDSGSDPARPFDAT